MEKNDERRTLIELLDEVMEDKIENNFSTLSIVVGFEKTTKFLDVHDDRITVLTELTRLVNAGGEPVGVIGTIRSDGHQSCTLYHRVFREYADEEWVYRFFEALLNSMAETAARQGIRVIRSGQPDNN